MPNISVYLSVEEFKKLVDMAEAKNVKPTILARQLIREGLDAKPKA